RAGTQNKAMRVQMPAPARMEDGGDRTGVAGGEVDAVVVAKRARGGLPGVADPAADAPGARVRHPDRVGVCLREPNGRKARPLRGEPAREERPVNRRGDDDRRRPGEHQPRVAGEDGGEGTHADERHGSAGEDHRGTGTVERIESRSDSTFTPSNCASARSCTRWRSVGWASALTSSGVM